MDTEKRIEKLESQCRIQERETLYLKISLLVLFAISCAIVFTPRLANASSDVTDIIRTERIELVREDGSAWAVLGTDPVWGPSMTTRVSDGTSEGKITSMIADDGWFMTWKGLELHSDEHGALAVLTNFGDEYANLELRGEHGPFAEINNFGLTILGQPDRAQSSFGANGMSIIDGSGDPYFVVGFDNIFGPMIYYRDEEGQIVNYIHQYH